MLVRTIQNFEFEIICQNKPSFDVVAEMVDYQVTRVQAISELGEEYKSSEILWKDILNKPNFSYLQEEVKMLDIDWSKESLEILEQQN